MRHFGIAIAADRIAEGKRLYELTSTPVRDIATMMGVSRRTLTRRVREWGWVPRYPPRHVTDRGAVATASPGADGGVAVTRSVFDMPSPGSAERMALAAYYHRTVERGLDAVHRILDKAGPADEAGAERSARVLAVTFRALRDMSAVMPPEETATDDEADTKPLPRSIDEFREALAIRIERIVRAYRSGAVASASGNDRGDDGRDRTR